MKISLFLGMISLAPMLSVLGSKTIEGFSDNSMEPTTGSLESSALKGKLPVIEGEFWVMEDVSGNQPRVHTQAETTWPQYPTQPGDSHHAVDNQIGHAQLIQYPLYMAEGLVLRKL